MPVLQLYPAAQNPRSPESILPAPDGLRWKETASGRMETEWPADSRPETLRTFVEKAEEHGWSVAAETGRFPVLDMSCAACAMGVTSILEAMPGILRARVNYASATLSVRYLPAWVQPADMKLALQQAGYDLLIPEGGNMREKLSKEKAKRYISLINKAFVSGILSIPIVLLGMFFMHAPGASYWMWALSTPVIFWAGSGFFRRALKSRKPGMDALVALSTGVAYLFSVLFVLFPDFWKSRGLTPHVYFESAAVVITFLLLGKVLEEKARQRSSDAIRRLQDLRPEMAERMLENGELERISVDEVLEGDILRVKPGMSVPADGSVVSGTSRVDERMLTGEPHSRLKSTGDLVFAGTMNESGSFDMLAEKVGENTKLGRIIRLVEEAQGSQAPIQSLADKISAIFVPVVTGIALISWILWWTFGGADGFFEGLNAFVTVLVIACPCALGLATPTALIVGLGAGAVKGMLIRDARALETAARVDVVVMDKTGTLTEGKPEVLVTSEFSQEDLEAIYALEMRSEHPLAHAIIQFTGPAGEIVPSEFAAHTGRGISGSVNGSMYFIGSRRWMEELGLETNPALMNAGLIQEPEGRTVVWIGKEKQVLGWMAIGDRIREDAADCVKALHNNGIQIHMLTGDRAPVARAVANKLKIQHVKAGVLPEDKLSYIRELQAEGHKVAMVGDGINDGAALAAADLGLAMGKGSDIAMESADITLINNQLSGVSEAMRLSSQTLQTIRQNLFWAFIYNVTGIPIAAGLLQPITGFRMDPMYAGAAMALSSLSVLVNSLRLGWKLRRN